MKYLRGGLLALLLISAPLAVAVMLSRSGLADRVQRPQPADAIITSPVPADPFRRLVVVAYLNLAEGDRVVSPAWTGVVTDVYVHPGDHVESGQRVVQVDGVTRVAWFDAQPFSRELRQGDRGFDVDSLHRLLVSDGAMAINPGPGSTFGEVTGRAVEALAAKLGVPTARRTFDPAWVVRIPTPDFVVGTVGVSVGDVAPQTEILRSPPNALSVNVRRPDGTLPDPGPAWRFVVDDLDLAVDARGQLDGDYSQRLLDWALVRQSQTGESPATVDGVVQAEVNVGAVRVPATAVVIDTDGTACVFRPVDTQPGASFGMVPVRLVTDTVTVGVANITGLDSGIEIVAPVLANVDVCIESGTVVGLIGPSGSGKSTLLAIIGLLTKPTTGSVVLDGQSHVSTASSSAKMRDDMAWILQTSTMLPRQSALANARLGALSRGIRDPEATNVATEALGLVRMDLLADKAVTQLSGGEVQRVGIARAVAARPRLLLADEPTGHLDAATSHVAFDALTSAHHGARTTIIATHDMEVVDRCDLVYAV